MIYYRDNWSKVCCILKSNPLRQLFVELARDHSDDPTCKNGGETWAAGASMVLDGFVEFC